MKNSENSREAASENKKKTKVWIYRTLMAVCVIVLAVAGWKLYSIWADNHQIVQETEELRTFVKAPEPVQQDSQQNSQSEAKPDEDGLVIDWAGLKAANPNVVAWLIVPGTGISYPVVQASDNSYYLNHTFNGAVNYIGAIFLDSAAVPDFMDDNSIIYGHSVDIGGMFTSLKDFADEAFFSSHPYFWILTPQQNYRASITAFYQGSDDAAIYTTSFGDYRDEVLEDIASQAMYVRRMDTGNRPFVTLSTCNLSYGFNSDQRYVLMGALEEWNEPISAQEEY